MLLNEIKHPARFYRHQHVPETVGNTEGVSGQELLNRLIAYALAV